MGFIPFGAAMDADLPREPGVYLVWRVPIDPVVFLERSVGGHFKGKDPTVPPDVLKAKWVDGSPLLYIGKATNLRTRLRQYARFGQGAAIGHYGGRYIWQIESSQDLLIAWMSTVAEDPREVEVRLIGEFRQVFGAAPFANLAD